MRGLAPPRHPVALDSVGAEDGSQRKIHRFEHRPLLDVELEVRSRILELLSRLRRPVEIDAVRSDRIRQWDTVSIRQLPELVLIPHRVGRGARAEE
jgi:hypothetical protein